MAETKVHKPEVDNTTTPPEKKAPEVIKGAAVLTPQLVQKILAVFDEMPRRYSNLIDPVQAELFQSPRADITLNDKK